MKALPFLCCLARPSVLLRATVVELALIVGHLLLYPTGIHQEQPRAVPVTGPGPGPGPGPDTTTYTGTGTGTGTGTTTYTGTEGNAATGTVTPAPAGRTAAPPTGDRGHPPVVLVHGLSGNRSVFVSLRRSLLRHGWRHVEALNYSPLTSDLRKAAELLGHHVEQCCERTGRSRVDLVGHSLGGLVARYYVQRLGGDLRVRTLVTLGTPHGGTWLAPLASVHPLVRQLGPHSDVIVELERPAPNCRTHFVCFWSDLDELMVPSKTACIDHQDLITRSVRVSGLGHLTLAVNGAVAAGIREALSAEEEAEGGASRSSVA
ncbi:lipase family alpha/beta hydrolase [Streptomyces sp. NPDC017056]|uniref:lipase family alpha/beta hydrolase n=1 Tax=Streptomyces sp. NPDC017056 TaxID=3364973 RepID=UPI003789B2FB